MSRLQRLLADFEEQLPGLASERWDEGLHPRGEPTNLRMERRTMPIEGPNPFNGLYMLHRFTQDGGLPETHHHNFAIAVHVLGPGAYGMGLSTEGVCHFQTVVEGAFYYEMRTKKVQHFLFPLTEPIYTVSLLASYEEVDHGQPDHTSLRPAEELLPLVKDVFDSGGTRMT